MNVWNVASLFRFVESVPSWVPESDSQTPQIASFGQQLERTNKCYVQKWFNKDLLSNAFEMWTDLRERLEIEKR